MAIVNGLGHVSEVNWRCRALNRSGSHILTTISDVRTGVEALGGCARDVCRRSNSELVGFSHEPHMSVFGTEKQKKRKKSEGVNSAVLAAPNDVLFNACRGEE